MSNNWHFNLHADAETQVAETPRVVSPVVKGSRSKENRMETQNPMTSAAPTWLDAALKDHEQEPEKTEADEAPVEEHLEIPLGFL